MRKFTNVVVQVSTGTTLFDIGVGPGSLVLSDQFLQITTKLPSTNVYGLGEHVHDYFKHEMNKTWTSFARDQPPSWDAMANLYGTHPFYTCVEDALGNTHGILLLNSNAQEYSFSDLPSLTFRTIGGILDFYIFLGPSPEEVIQQYTAVIGRPVMPPYWALGFQLCRYDYQNISNLKEAVDSTARYEIPHDVQYVDIDHMDTQKIFTVDHKRFPNLNDYFKELQKGGMRIIYILDPCMISNETDYYPYEEMKRNNCNIKWAPNVTVPDNAKDTDGALLGYVWPQGKTVFPDYLKISTKAVWKKLIVDYRNNLTFDGLWIDMNEPASFGTNEERPFNWPENVKPYWSLQCPKNFKEDPPYRPKAAYLWDTKNRKGRLSDKTICMSTVQGDNDEYSHYDVHNLYGWSQSDVTLDAVREATGERGIVISRSTFPGSGQWVGHWLGDNVSQWKDMLSSIIGLLEFNLFGIPYIGADICGFFENTTEELCLRWMQLGAFYTFSRNHNTKGPIPQGPGQLGDDVGFASRDIMRVRYQLLPYLYTLFYYAHTKGSTVIRPLHHEFPTDKIALAIDRQFLWGSCLLISPILEQGQTSLQYYLPRGTWYNYFTHDGETLSEGLYKSISVNKTSKPMLHLRGGCVIIQQDYANNTHYSRQKPLTIVATLDEFGIAAGNFYWDDGVSIDSIEKKKFYLADITVNNYQLSLTVQQLPPEAEWNKITFKKALLMGITNTVRHVTHKGTALAFRQSGQVLEVDLPDLPMTSDFSIGWLDGLDCFPEAEGNAANINQSKCEARGCSFYEDPVACRYNGSYGLSGSLFTPTQLGFTVNLNQKGKAPFGGDVTEWIFSYENRGQNVARFTFDTPDGKRYKVPKHMNLSPPADQSTLNYELKITNFENFAFQIVRASTKTVIFDIGVGPGSLVLSDQFLQITTKLPSTNVFGLGEHVHDHFKHDMNKTWTSFARDQPPSWDAMANLYGVHPFYTCVEDSEGNTHGILMLNSNAQEYSFTPFPSLTFRTIGGILDFYIFMGSSPEEVIQQYTQVIGRPVMPPYWALGFQLCRYDYHNISNLIEAVDSTARYSIPHDVQYVDIDHMDTQKIFTVDHKNFPNLNEYFHKLQSGGMRIIYILDPCMISNETDYEPYIQMNKYGCNIKWDPSVQPSNDSRDSDNALLGYVWPQGKTVFPDYLKQSTKMIWKNLIVNYRKNLTFDGIWIDMNEPASFGTNEERPFNWPENVKPYWSLQCPKNMKEDPPYRPKAAYLWDRDNKKGRLSDKTICMSTVQGDNDEYSHYDVHSLYGWSQSDTTLDAVREATGERGMVISRSTFPGSGQWVGHWLGDNVSQWKDMLSSIIGLLEFNLFGIPYIGADICGFFENTTEELCLRWMQLGAFYTFSRNHNTKGPIPQGPGQLGDTVGLVSRDIMRVRYRLLPYLYTLFFEAHTKGSTVIRPMHHEYPTDQMALSIDKQFMWGSCLLISPILNEGQTILEYYLPKGKWYDYFKQEGEVYSKGELKSVDVNITSMPMLHLRGGCIIVEQDYANNTHYSRQNHLTIVAALDSNGQASGKLFWDDGVSHDFLESGNYYLATIKVENSALTLKVDHNTSSVNSWDNLTFTKAVVLGVNMPVQYVILQDQELYYNQTGELLEIDLSNIPMRDAFQLTWYRGMDCFPEAEGNFDAVIDHECLMRGCYYNSDLEICSYNWSSYNLEAVNVTYTDFGLVADLKQVGPMAPFGGDIKDWVFKFENQGDNVAHFSFDSKDGKRYKVPKAMNLPMKSTTPKYDIVITDTKYFRFQIIRSSTKTVIFDIGVGPGGLVLSDQFLQITTKLPSTNVYGLGEHVHDHFKHEMNKTWTSFARDQPPSWDAMANLYGVHPFYTCVEDNDGNTHGILLLNSNAQEYAFSDLPSLTFRTIGGILDFYLFMGSSPEEVIQQYTGVIGRPVMPPYWALGFQLCRYDYHNISNLKEAVDSTARYDIPHDVQYVDIDHMDTQKIFTVDEKRFPGLNDYFKSLNDGGMRIIYILDPCMISNETDYYPYEEMKRNNCNIKWAPNVTVPDDAKDTDGALLGYVWPQGKTVFPDYLKNSTKTVWKKLIVDYRKNLTFDGLWIDMNEPASFGTNEDRPFNWPAEVKPYWSLKCPNNSIEDPPYRPKAAYRWDSDNKKGRLSDKTICMSTVQGDNDKYSHYDVHSLYGWSQSDVTLDAVREATGERGMVISRSTFPGSGQWVGHWLGDNVSQWKDMFSSIIGLLEFNLFGIPYIGADICGFFENTTEELCLRWMQLGAFYTFSRNHNTKGPIPQGPGQLGDRVGNASRDIMRIRYQLLPYLYTLFYEAHTEGSTVIRPLHHEYPTDQIALNIEKQFLWGSSLLISPILEQGQTVLEYYLPKGKWYNYYSHEGETLKEGSLKVTSVNITSKPLLHLRGGHIVVQQKYANNTHFSRKNPLQILAALSETGEAIGSLYWDDGISIDSIDDGLYYLLNVTVQMVSLSVCGATITSVFIYLMIVIVHS
uniref:P-type domain-containing protein n=1 Tax=Biomphalaria glabrata TaxID=6526 RepID=A0A2C9KG08_BIOGL